MVENSAPWPQMPRDASSVDPWAGPSRLRKGFYRKGTLC